jgi:hypothetical protein
MISKKQTKKANHKKMSKKTRQEQQKVGIYGKHT